MAAYARAPIGFDARATSKTLPAVWLFGVLLDLTAGRARTGAGGGCVVVACVYTYYAGRARTGAGGGCVVVACV